MTWNYRVCKQTYSFEGVLEEDVTVAYGFHEVYYNKDQEITFTSVDPSPIVTDIVVGEDDGDALRNLLTSLKWMTDALTKPIVDLDSIVYANPDGDIDDE